jgi:hypothetical protein
MMFCLYLSFVAPFLVERSWFLRNASVPSRTGSSAVKQLGVEYYFLMGPGNGGF